MRKKLLVILTALLMLGIFAGMAIAKGNEDVNQQGNINIEKHGLKKAVEFKDMQNEWSREAVMQATVEGTIEGYDDGTFRPNQPLTNLEAIAMLTRSIDPNIDESNTLEPEDANLIKRNIPDWGQKYIAAALEQELLTQEELKSFNPYQGIKRYELCKYLARIDNEDNEVIEVTKNEFVDIDKLPSKYQDAIQDVFAKGLMQGDPGSLFAPNRVLKRCEMAVIMGRLDENILHHFDQNRVKGVLEEKIIPPVEGKDYTISVDIGEGDPVIVNADENTKVFLNGKEFAVEDLDEIDVDTPVKILIKDDVAVLVSFNTADVDEEDNIDSTDKDVEQEEVKGIIESFTGPDSGVYQISLEGHSEPYSVDEELFEDNEPVIGVEIELILEDDVVVKIKLDVEENEED